MESLQQQSIKYCERIEENYLTMTRREKIDIHRCVKRENRINRDQMNRRIKEGQYLKNGYKRLHIDMHECMFMRTHGTILWVRNESDLREALITTFYDLFKFDDLFKNISSYENVKFNVCDQKTTKLLYSGDIEYNGEIDIKFKLMNGLDTEKLYYLSEKQIK